LRCAGADPGGREPGEAADERQGRRPHVHGHTGDEVSGFGGGAAQPQDVQPHPPEAEQAEVEGEHLTVSQSQTTGQDDGQDAADEVPHGFDDNRRQRQTCLCEIGPGPGDSAEQEPGGHGSEERQESDAVEAGDRPGGEAADDESAREDEAAVPDRQGCQRVAVRAEVRPRGGDEVTDPAADDGRGDRDDRDRPQITLVSAARVPLQCGHPYRETDPEDGEADPCRAEAHAHPSASSEARRPSPGTPSESRARTRAEPTMTPSAYSATSAAWSRLDTPR